MPDVENDDLLVDDIDPSPSYNEGNWYIEIPETDAPVLNLYESSTQEARSIFPHFVDEVEIISTDVDGAQGDDVRSVITALFGEYQRPTEYQQIYYNGELVAETEVYLTGFQSLDITWIAGVFLFCICLKASFGFMRAILGMRV